MDRCALCCLLLTCWPPALGLFFCFMARFLSIKGLWWGRTSLRHEVIDRTYVNVGSTLVVEEHLHVTATKARHNMHIGLAYTAHLGLTQRKTSGTAAQGPAIIFTGTLYFMVTEYTTPILVLETMLVVSLHLTQLSSIGMSCKCIHSASIYRPTIRRTVLGTLQARVSKLL